MEMVRRDWTETVEGEAYTVPDLEFYECPGCGEQVFDTRALHRIAAASPAHGVPRQRPGTE